MTKSSSSESCMENRERLLCLNGARNWPNNSKFHLRRNYDRVVKIWPKSTRVAMLIAKSLLMALPAMPTYDYSVIQHVTQPLSGMFILHITCTSLDALFVQLLRLLWRRRLCRIYQCLRDDVLNFAFFAMRIILPTWRFWFARVIVRTENRWQLLRSKSEFWSFVNSRQFRKCMVSHESTAKSSDSMLISNL
jgi:hypothetical protein